MSYKTADRIFGAGVLLLILGVVMVVAGFASWMEIGHWTEVNTWFTALTGAVLVLGLTLARWGDKTCERWRVENVPGYREQREDQAAVKALRKARKRTPDPLPDYYGKEE